MSKEYDVQTLTMTRAAAQENIARTLMDYEDWRKEAAAELARKIAHQLGFQ